MPDIVGQRRANQGRLQSMLSGSSPATSLSPDQLLERFATGNPRQRRSLIKTVEARIGDLEALGDGLLAPFDRSGDDWAAGWLLQVLHRHRPERVSDLLGRCPGGWFRVESAVGIDYRDLQQDLLQENFQAADRTTSAVLRQLAGSDAERRGYVYFSEVPRMSGADLTAIDISGRLSQGRFGFVQAVLQALGGTRPSLATDRLEV